MIKHWFYHLPKAPNSFLMRMPPRSQTPVRTVISPNHTRGRGAQSSPKSKPALPKNGARDASGGLPKSTGDGMMMMGGTTQAADKTSDANQILFPALLAEGDRLQRQGHYVAAISLFSRAIEIRPMDINALAARSRCRTLLGEHEAARRDAEIALEADPTFAKALTAKADAMYGSGDFEGALMWYHRGAQSRPDVDDFRVGVGRCQEAIMSAVDGIDPDKLRSRRAIEKQEEELRKKSGPKKGTGGMGVHPGAVGSLRPTGRHAGKGLIGAGAARRSINAASPHITRAPTAYDQETLERNLLEELYEDRAFLKSLAKDTKLMRSVGSPVSKLIEEGLEYTASRLEYWRMRNPSGRPSSGSASRARKPVRARQPVPKTTAGSLYDGADLDASPSGTSIRKTRAPVTT